MFRTSPVHHQERFVQAVFVDLVCGNTRTAGHVQPLPILQIQLVKNAPEDGPVTITQHYVLTIYMVFKYSFICFSTTTRHS